MDYTYDKTYAKEYLKYNPDALMVAVVWQGEYLVGVYTECELLCATLPSPCRIEYRPVIGFKIERPIIGPKKEKS